MNPDTSSSAPLFVDLDGTLIKTDLLMESALLLVKQAPWMIFSLPVWLLRGRGHLKARIAERVSLEADTFPLQNEFVAYLHEQHAAGREIHLATASDIQLAQPMADRLGIFTSVLASDGVRNLRSEAKLEAIQQLTNGGPFDYAGNAKADFPIWSKAQRAIVVNPGAGVESGAKKRTEVAHVFDDRPPTWRVWVKETRLYQWMKNLLIGVPMLTAHAFTAGNMLAVLQAFIAFGLVASATYLLNDLLDLASDRRHPRKCRRPFAAGNLGIAEGCVGMALMLIGGLAIAANISSMFLLSLLGYLAITLSYSMYFKSYVLIDVLLLASLYTVRIIAGAIAIQVEISSWLLAFSMFTFLSLALVKRSSELVAMEKLSRAGAKGRDYRLGDNQIISSMGTAAGYLSVLVLALFVDNAALQNHYDHPRRLWLLCPLMLYWISRLWLKTSRGEMEDDPLVFSLKDKASWLVVLGMIAVTLASI
ncbi:UbiA family prenyltransferase [Undibacterium sp.]|jgi:4-hydroxybenzoate polyprenyltransferase/phosphoserine phosphatase|uniref:UbiA family prenyltransferase n=1 Tax=Undibacterium sp. TaxID=1914977 RepID=UPI002C50A836|nr:UbiA family prenyltransferase [Undibacterium sp.]HTD05641.1 UbiA family prenyltransferase [Undibacterium sp.]